MDLSSCEIFLLKWTLFALSSSIWFSFLLSYLLTSNITEGKDYWYESMSFLYPKLTPSYNLGKCLVGYCDIFKSTNPHILWRSKSSSRPLNNPRTTVLRLMEIHICCEVGYNSSTIELESTQIYSFTNSSSE